MQKKDEMETGPVYPAMDGRDRDHVDLLNALLAERFLCWI